MTDKVLKSPDMIASSNTTSVFSYLWFLWYPMLIWYQWQDFEIILANTMKDILLW